MMSKVGNHFLKIPEAHSEDEKIRKFDHSKVNIQLIPTNPKQRQQSE